MLVPVRLIPFAAVLMGLAGLASNAHAQGTSLFGNSGPMNGSSGVGTASAGNSQMQNSAFPNASFGSGNSAATGSVAGGNNTAFGSQQQMGGAGAGGQQQGMVGQRNSRFVGNTQAGQQPGAQGQGTNNLNNRQGQNRNNTTRRAGQAGNNPNQSGMAGANPQNQQRTVRPQMVVNFDRTTRTSDRTQELLETRFLRLANKVQFQSVDIEVDGSKVILRGQVASQQDVKLATILARLEPGVRSVQNELTVVEDAAPVTE